MNYFLFCYLQNMYHFLALAPVSISPYPLSPFAAIFFSESVRVLCLD